MVAPHYVVNVPVLLWLPGVRVGKLCEEHFVLTQDGRARGHTLQMMLRRGLPEQCSPLPLGTSLWIQEHKATMLSEETGERIRL